MKEYYSTLQYPLINIPFLATFIQTLGTPMFSTISSIVSQIFLAVSMVVVDKQVTEVLLYHRLNTTVMISSTEKTTDIDVSIENAVDIKLSAWNVR